MLKFIAVLGFFLFSEIAIGLPRFADKSPEYLAARQAIAKVESAENPCAKNPTTSASGKYQFMKMWNRFFQANYGRTWASVVPSCKAAKAVKDKMARFQDEMFDVYYNLKVAPWIFGIRGKVKGWSDIELLALYHRQGEGGAMKYIRTGEDFANGKWGNGHVSKHIARVVRYSQANLIAMR
jgi:hypothetical protein